MATRRSANAGIGPTTKTPEEIAAIERECEARIMNGSDAIKGQHRMYIMARVRGQNKDGYAVLPDNVEEYDWDKVIWITGNDAVDTVMLMRAKVEATLGKPEGVYFIFFVVKANVNQSRPRVTEQRIARQIKAEYGIDPIPIARDLERNPLSPVGVRFMQLMMAMSS